jgi:hypothetical protein
MRSWKSMTLALLAAAVLLGTASEAKAAKIIFYQTGEDIFPAGPLPDPYKSNPQLAGVQAGYKCKIFGIFWAYITISGCEPVAFRGDTYDRNPELVAAIKKLYPTEATMQVPFWKKHGRFVLGGIVLILIIAAFMKKKKE